MIYTMHAESTQLYGTLLGNNLHKNIPINIDMYNTKDKYIQYVHVSLTFKIKL